MMWNILFVLVIVSATSCSVFRGETGFRLPMPEASTNQFLSNTEGVPDIAIRVAGILPLQQALQELIRLEVVRGYPAGQLPEVSFQVWETTRCRDLVKVIEEQCGWIWDSDSRTFYLALATHTADRPDSFGRPQNLERAPLSRRPLLRLHFRFRRYAASIFAQSTLTDLAGATGSVVGTSFTAICPDGLETTWSSTSERSYFEGVRDPADTGGLNRQVTTSRKTVSAGLQVSLLVARLPGNGFRIDGELEVASFSAGSGLDRNVIRFPLGLDAERGKWITTVLIRSADLSATVALRNFGIDLGASGDVVGLEVLID